MTSAKTKVAPAPVRYEDDVLLWSLEQARFLREGRFADLDIEHLADEIEDVGKSEKRELANRMAVLIAHLLKWSVQPAFRSNSWRSTINEQRRRVGDALEETPSLKTVMGDSKWRRMVWGNARSQAVNETGADVSESQVFSAEQILDPDFWPD